MSSDVIERQQQAMTSSAGSCSSPVDLLRALPTPRAMTSCTACQAERYADSDHVTIPAGFRMSQDGASSLSFIGDQSIASRDFRFPARILQRPTAPPFYRQPTSTGSAMSRGPCRWCQQVNDVPSSRGHDPNMAADCVLDLASKSRRRTSVTWPSSCCFRRRHSRQSVMADSGGVAVICRHCDGGETQTGSRDVNAHVRRWRRRRRRLATYVMVGCLVGLVVVCVGLVTARWVVGFSGKLLGIGNESIYIHSKHNNRLRGITNNVT
jgi:hypothetical protein